MKITLTIISILSITAFVHDTSANDPCDCKSILNTGKVETIYTNESVIMHYYLREVQSRAESSSSDQTSLFGEIAPITLGFNHKSNKAIAESVASKNVDLNWEKTSSFIKQNYIDPSVIAEYRECLKNSCMISMTVEKLSSKDFIVNISYGNPNVSPGTVDYSIFSKSASITHEHITNDSFGRDEIEGSYTIFVKRKHIREPIFGMIKVKTARGTSVEADIYIPPVAYRPVEDWEIFNLTGKPDPGSPTPIYREFITSSEIDQRLVMVITGQATSINRCSHDAKVLQTDLKVYKEMENGERMEVTHWNFYKEALCYDENRTLLLDRKTRYIVEGSINFMQWPKEYANVTRLNLYLKNDIPE